MDIRLLAENAKKASIALSGVSSQQKNDALNRIVQELYSNKTNF